MPRGDLSKIHAELASLRQKQRGGLRISYRGSVPYLERDQFKAPSAPQTARTSTRTARNSTRKPQLPLTKRAPPTLIAPTEAKSPSPEPPPASEPPVRASPPASARRRRVQPRRVQPRQVNSWLKVSPREQGRQQHAWEGGTVVACCHFSRMPPVLPQPITVLQPATRNDTTDKGSVTPQPAAVPFGQPLPPPSLTRTPKEQRTDAPTFEPSVITSQLPDWQPNLDGLHDACRRARALGEHARGCKAARVPAPVVLLPSQMESPPESPPKQTSIPKIISSKPGLVLVDKGRRVGTPRAKLAPYRLPDGTWVRPIRLKAR